MMVALRNLVLQDFWLKLFSLGLAILIWYIVSDLAYRKESSPVQGMVSAAPEKSFPKIPVSVMSSASDVRNFTVSPDQVIVTVRGEAARLQELRSQDIRALVDLSGIEAASGLRKRIEVTTPPGITLVSVTPAEVDVLVPGKP